MNPVRATALGSFLILAGNAIGEIRTWTDSSGNHKREAEFVSLATGVVTLKDASGKTVYSGK